MESLKKARKAIFRSLPAGRQASAESEESADKGHRAAN